jgi:hypothetical protein
MLNTFWDSISEDIITTLKKIDHNPEIIYDLFLDSSKSMLFDYKEYLKYENKISVEELKKSAELYKPNNPKVLFNSSGTSGVKSYVWRNESFLDLRFKIVQVLINTMIFVEGEKLPILFLDILNPKNRIDFKYFWSILYAISEKSGIKEKVLFCKPTEEYFKDIYNWFDSNRDQTVAIIGSHFNIWKLLELFKKENIKSISLKEGSRISESGGFKQYKIDSHEYKNAIEEVLGIKENFRVASYNATEIATPFVEWKLWNLKHKKDNTFSDFFAVPPWVKVSVTNESKLVFEDLLNIELASIVETSDKGLVNRYGFKFNSR